MASNLPPGCSDADIPGCTPEDHAIDKAIESKRCEACKHYDRTVEDVPCNDCTAQDSEHFDKEDDETAILERLEASALREDEHKDV